MSHRRSHGGKRGIPTESANMIPLGGARHSYQDRAAPPPAKQPRVDTPRSSSSSGHHHHSSSTSAASNSHEYAGKAAEKMFPDGKTTLNNALQIDLRRLNTRLDYEVERVPTPYGSRTDLWRCKLELPYPEKVSVYGEGINKKDAEKRCSAAACLKLLDLGFINSRGKRVEQHHGISEDQKPKQLDVPMASQVQLFDAISHLPEAQSFPNWASLEMFYNAQKQHVQGVPQESGNAIFNFKFKAPANRSQDSQGHSDAIVGSTSQATNVILPAMLKRQFPTAQDTPLALLPCPHCMQNITISMSHIGKLDNPLAQFLGGQGDEEEEEEKKRAAIEVKPSLEDPGNAPILAEIEKQMQGENAICVFTGQPYSDLRDEEAESRSKEMKKDQEEVERAGRHDNSPRATAKKLPISRSKNALLREVNTKPVVVVTGMTGSGKTTQVPQFILENYIEHSVGATCNIIVTQPRRISAISVAERVAVERGEPLGRTVGYQVRLDSMMPRHPGRILFCTTGILLMKMRKNPFLQGVSHVIVDEVHERDINSDFLLILLREIVRAGVNVKVLLMSASVDAKLYVDYFMDKKAGIPVVPCVNVEGHCYSVTEHYLDRICNMIGWRGMTTEDQGLPDTNVELVTNLLAHLGKTQPVGAILVFLPGWDDIMSVQDLLSNRLRSELHHYLILPCHSMLSSRDQQAVFATPPQGVRKIILATNIAESSITIDDIVYVVNSGTVKVKTFDTTKKITHLATQWSSKSSVIQRRGRAGRCQAGHAYNLFTKEQFACMDEYQVPEMQRTPLEDLVLQAKLLNPWQRVAVFLSHALTPPRTAAIYSAVNVLKDLGALDDNEALTPMGKALAELPIEPLIGRLVLLGAVLGALDPILTIAAAMGYRDPFVNPPTKRQQADEVRSTLAAGCCSDHLLITRAYAAWQKSRDGNSSETTFIRENFLHRGTLNMMEGLRKQFQTHLMELGLKDLEQYNELSSSEAMIRAILTAGLSPNVMKMAKMLESGGHRGHGEGVRKRVRTGFKTIQDGRVFIHPSSVNSEKNFPSNWFVYYEKVKTSKVFIRDCTLVHPLTLLLFAGKSIDIISEDAGKAVIGLDGKNWFAFEVPMNLADLLQCGRRAVSGTVSAGLRGRLGRLTPAHREFLAGMNRFLIANTHFNT